MMKMMVLGNNFYLIFIPHDFAIFLAIKEQPTLFQPFSMGHFDILHISVVVICI